MRAFFAAGFIALLLMVVPSHAAVTPPWEKAQALLDKVTPELAAGGIKALAPHVGEFEQALADADKPFEGGERDTVVLLTDGMMDQMAAIAAASKAMPGKKIVTVPDPYPVMALYLGSYYNEIGKPAEALRVLEREKNRNIGTTGDHVAALTSERAISLLQLGRLGESLATYDEGLKLDNIDDAGKARMHRGRGYVLCEMGRLDEAEAAYKESLKFEPDNRIALSELEYIAKLKKGGKKETGGIVLPKTDNSASQQQDQYLP